MTREELREHCEKQIEMCELWAISKGEKASGKIYEEHKLILELLEQEPTAKLVPIAEIKFDEDKLKELVNKAVLTVTSQDPRWMPVSERLPEEDTDVLVTLKCGLIGIMQKKLADDDNGESCYIWEDFEGEEHEVIAWMPLPEPYKGES